MTMILILTLIPNLTLITTVIVNLNLTLTLILTLTLTAQAQLRSSPHLLGGEGGCSPVGGDVIILHPLLQRAHLGAVSRQRP